MVFVNIRVLLVISVTRITDARYGECGYFVQKNTTSTVTRFLYVTGLERSGVRAFTNILQKHCPQGLCVPAQATLRALTTDFSAFLVGQDNDGDITEARRVETIDAFRGDATKFRGKLIVMNDVVGKPAIYGKSDDTLQQPNLHVLAALAEIAGVDLRIALLDRDSDSIVNSLKQFQGKNATVLADNAAVLASHLNMIDSAFVTRFPFLDVVAESALLSDRLGSLHPGLSTTPRSMGEVTRQDVDHVPNLAPRDSSPFELHVQTMIDVLLRSTLGEPVDSDQSLVQKTIFSDENRFVFVAGLEGTGHHAIGSLFRNCNEHNQLCDNDREASMLLYNGNGKPHGVFVFLLDTQEHDIESRRVQFVNQLKEKNTQPGRHLVILNTMGGNGELSYPNYGGANKPLDHVNIRELAYLAEQAGVDLRIIVLCRPAKEILTSTTEHRNFGTRNRESAILADNAAVLAAELQLIDQRFYLSIPFEQIGNVTWWSGPPRRFSVSPATNLNTRFATPGGMPAASRAAWLHPDLPGEVLEASVHDLELPSEFPSPLLQNDPSLQINATSFIFERDISEAHLAASSDYLYRTAGCGCGA